MEGVRKNKEKMAMEKAMAAEEAMAAEVAEALAAEVAVETLL